MFSSLQFDIIFSFINSRHLFDFTYHYCAEMEDLSIPTNLYYVSTGFKYRQICWLHFLASVDYCLRKLFISLLLQSTWKTTLCMMLNYYFWKKYSFLTMGHIERLHYCNIILTDIPSEFETGHLGYSCNFTWILNSVFIYHLWFKKIRSCYLKHSRHLVIIKVQGHAFIYLVISIPKFSFSNNDQEVFVRFVLCSTGDIEIEQRLSKLIRSNIWKYD